MLVGVPSTPVELNAGAMLGQEKQFRGSHRRLLLSRSRLPDVSRLGTPMGDLDLDALVTERYPIDDINEATTALEEGRISGRAILEFA